MFVSQTIILVEDDPAQRELIERALRDARVGNLVVPLASAAQAVEYLDAQASVNSAAEELDTGLMLLDLKLDGEDSGFELLRWVRAHPRFRKLPVIVLTDSHAEEDINRAYDLGANSYLVKPLQFDDLKQLLKTINGYWVIMVEKPRI